MKKFKVSPYKHNQNTFYAVECSKDNGKTWKIESIHFNEKAAKQKKNRREFVQDLKIFFKPSKKRK